MLIWGPLYAFTKIISWLLGCLPSPRDLMENFAFLAIHILNGRRRLKSRIFRIRVVVGAHAWSLNLVSLKFLDRSKLSQDLMVLLLNQSFFMSSLLVRIIMKKQACSQS